MHITFFFICLNIKLSGEFISGYSLVVVTLSEMLATTALSSAYLMVLIYTTTYWNSTFQIITCSTNHCFSSQIKYNNGMMIGEYPCFNPLPICSGQNISNSNISYLLNSAHCRFQINFLPLQSNPMFFSIVITFVQSTWSQAFAYSK